MKIGAGNDKIRIRLSSLRVMIIDQDEKKGKQTKSAR